jgi:hypothetical protein
MAMFFRIVEYDPLIVARVIRSDINASRIIKDTQSKSGTKPASLIPINSTIKMPIMTNIVYPT